MSSDFYRDRDRIVGGTDNAWSAGADFSLSSLDQDGDVEDTVNARDGYWGAAAASTQKALATNSGPGTPAPYGGAGVLSQSDLAS